MDTKSRYEVIAELEEKKRTLILERDSFDDKVIKKEKDIKLMKREVEDMEEDLKEYKESIEKRKDTIKELIGSVDDSLKRFEALGSQSQKK